MVCFYQFYRGEEFPASKLCKVGNVLNGIMVRDCPTIQSTIVATGSPAVFFLGDEVEGRSPGAIGTPSGAVSDHFPELGFHNSEAVQC